MGAGQAIGKAVAYSVIELGIGLGSFSAGCTVANNVAVRGVRRPDGRPTVLRWAGANFLGTLTNGILFTTGTAVNTLIFAGPMLREIGSLIQNQVKGESLPVRGYAVEPYKDLMKAGSKVRN